MRSNFSRKKDSNLTEEQFRELDAALFECLEKISPLIAAWLHNAEEVKNFIKIPVYEESDRKDLAFTIVIKKNNCGSEYVCPLCQDVKKSTFEGELEARDE